MLLGCNDSLIQFEEPGFIMCKINSLYQAEVGRVNRHRVSLLEKTGMTCIFMFKHLIVYTLRFHMLVSHSNHLHLSCPPPSLIFSLLFSQVHCSTHSKRHIKHQVIRCKMKCGPTLGNKGERVDRSVTTVCVKLAEQQWSMQVL